jgi:hypothetical protein
MENPHGSSLDVSLGHRCLVGRGPCRFQTTGTVQQVDAEKGILVIRVNGQVRTVKSDKSIKVLDRQGKELADGLKSKELTAGIEATFTIEPEMGEPVIKAIRLGKKETLSAKEKSSVGLKPLTEMTAEDRYKGEDGGLYGSGKNEPPEAHRAAALAESKRITPALEGRQDRADVARYVEHRRQVADFQGNSGS